MTKDLFADASLQLAPFFLIKKGTSYKLAPAAFSAI
jgi:hypothetical protein